MKKLSFARKLRLALNAVDRPVFIFAAYTLFLSFIVPLNYSKVSEGGEGTVINVLMIISLATFNGMGAILVPSLVMQRMKFFETLPMKLTDIRETVMLNILISHLIMTVPIAVVTAVTAFPMIPYMFCAQCVQLMLVMTLVMPFYFADKYMYTPSAPLEKKEQRSIAKKGAFIGIGFMLLIALDYGFILRWGLYSADSSGTVWVMLISAAALIISGASAAVCRKLKAVR